MNKNGQKDFKNWMGLKEKIDASISLRTFSEGEVWWCKIGENVGKEMCGKGKDYLRPVLVLRKLSKYNFIGVPLTSKRHVGSWYVEFVFQDKHEYAVVAQVENISTQRLHYKLGKVPSDDLMLVRMRLLNLLKNES